LKPRTIIGEVNLRSIANVSLEPGDLAVTALSQVTPLFQIAEKIPGNQIEGTYSSLGNARKVGVLYLERPLGVPTESDEKTLGTFNILKQALCDILHLR
jgi:hypothetical protein